MLTVIIDGAQAGAEIGKYERLGLQRHQTLGPKHSDSSIAQQFLQTHSQSSSELSPLSSKDKLLVFKEVFISQGAVRIRMNFQAP